MSAIISKASSTIKVKAIKKNKKKVDTTKAEKKIDEIKGLLDNIAEYYEKVAASYKTMLDTAGLDDNEASCKLDTSTTIGKSINQYYNVLNRRAGNCKNRKADLESAYAEATNTEAQYLSKRLAEAEKQIAALQQAVQEDKNES